MPAVAAVPASGLGVPNVSTTERLMTASNGGLQYYLRLPTAVTARRAQGIPFVFIFTGSSKDWVPSIQLYASYVDSLVLPFGLVCVLDLMNGGSASGGAPWSGMTAYTNTYPPAVISTWTTDAIGYGFELDGIQQIIRDLKTSFNASDYIYGAGYSGGGSGLHACGFNFPELFKGLAFASPNYVGKGVDAPAPPAPYAPISTNAARSTLYMKYWRGADDPNYPTPLQAQLDTVQALEVANQYSAAIPGITQVAGQGHVPLPDQTLPWLYSLLPAGQR